MTSNKPKPKTVEDFYKEDRKRNEIVKDFNRRALESTKKTFKDRYVEQMRLRA